MMNGVALLGEEEVSGDIFKDMSLLDNEFLNQGEALGEQVQIKSLEEISQDLSSLFLKKNKHPSWKIIKSENCTINVGGFANYSTALMGLDAFQYIMREALEEDGESEFSVINTETQIQFIKNVLAHGVDINKPYFKVDGDDVTPLSQAANWNNIALLNFLLSKGAQVTPSVLRAIPSEISEFSNESARTVSFLIGRGVHINMSDDLGGIMHTTFFSNCYNDSFMAFLLENGLDHKVMNKEGRTLLHIAAQKRNHDQSLMLMAKGADLYLADRDGITPFDLATGDLFKYRLEIHYKKYQEQRLELDKSQDRTKSATKVEGGERPEVGASGSGSMGILGVPSAEASSVSALPGMALAGAEFILSPADIALGAALRAMWPAGLVGGAAMALYGISVANSEQLNGFVAVANRALSKDPHLQHLPLSVSSVARASSLLPDLDWSNPDDYHTLKRAALGAEIEARTKARTLSDSVEDEDGSGICKVAYPYSPDDENYKNPIEAKRDLLTGVYLYGINPGKIEMDSGVLNINTELPGGDIAARECVRNLTGKDVDQLEKIKDGVYRAYMPDGTILIYRPLGKSGDPKVEWNGTNSNKIYEKITFKD